MKKYIKKEIIKNEEILDKIICDVCKKEINSKYYIEAIADGNAYLRLNYCPKCGRKLKEDD